jgi:hypothetical protein
MIEVSDGIPEYKTPLASNTLFGGLITIVTDFSQMD